MIKNYNKQYKTDRISMRDYLKLGGCLSESPDDDKFSLNGIKIWITKNNQIDIFIRNKMYLRSIPFRDVYINGIHFYIDRLMSRLFDMRL